MRLALIGVGQAGGKIVDTLLAYERRSRTSFVTAAVAVNTARADLLDAEEVPMERRILIGASRVIELQQTAVETQRTMNRLREEAPEALGKLIWTGDGELEPPF